MSATLQAARNNTAAAVQGAGRLAGHATLIDDDVRCGLAGATDTIAPGTYHVSFDVTLDRTSEITSELTSGAGFAGAGAAGGRCAPSPRAGDVAYSVQDAMALSSARPTLVPRARDLGTYAADVYVVVTPSLAAAYGLVQGGWRVRMELACDDADAVEDDGLGRAADAWRERIR